jgi:hypothetical protein
MPSLRLTDISGFRLECDGFWLNKIGPPSHRLTLDFQASNVLPGDGTAEVWIHSLETFMDRNLLEIGTIFDRLPLDRASLVWWNLLILGVRRRDRSAYINECFPNRGP